ncbi:MAG: Tudor-knot domain-containing protein [Prochlorothrix sp.]
MVKSIVQLVDDLPADNITVKVLKALDYLAPGQWSNLVGFEATVTALTGETDAQVLARMRERADAVYNAPDRGYQAAVRLYQTVDKADVAMATAALANKVGEKISFLSFLNKITPKADTTQTIDLALKIVVEVLAYSKLNGLQPNPQALVTALQSNYTDAAFLRMVALVCFDALLPLGPDFAAKIQDSLSSLDMSGLAQNPVFAGIQGDVPGGGTAEKANFLKQSFAAVEGWIKGLIDRTGLTPQGVTQGLSNFIQIADDNLDFVAAFLDQTTNYYEHTGIQTVARHLILAIYPEVKAEVAAEKAAAANKVATKTASVALGAVESGAGVYQVDQAVEVWDEDEEDWYAAKILKVREKKDDTQYYVHYDGYGSSEEEWVWGEDIRVRDLDNSDDEGFAVGQTVKVWDDDEEEWYSAVIREIRRQQYYVHYFDTDETEDEWVDLDQIS